MLEGHREESGTWEAWAAPGWGMWGPVTGAWDPTHPHACPSCADPAAGSFASSRALAAVDLLPLMGGSEAKGKLNALLEMQQAVRFWVTTCSCTSVRSPAFGVWRKNSSPVLPWMTWNALTAAPGASWMQVLPVLSPCCASLTAKRWVLPLCRVLHPTCWRIC